MPSVYVKHKRDLDLYRTLGEGRVDGRLLFAMAILSDVQHLTQDRAIIEELDEVKELISDVAQGKEAP